MGFTLRFRDSPLVFSDMPGELDVRDKQSREFEELQNWLLRNIRTIHELDGIADSGFIGDREALLASLVDAHRRMDEIKGGAWERRKLDARLYNEHSRGEGTGPVFVSTGAYLGFVSTGCSY